MISINTGIQLALEFSLSKHHHQVRKLGDKPYSVHPVSVAMILLEAGEGENVIISALLHDTIEDTDASYPEILDLFGPEVTSIVKECSEHDKSSSWEERKEHTIKSFTLLSRDSQMVMLADKIHNLKSIKMNFDLEGDIVWNHFKRGYDLQKWYYSSLKKAFSESEYLMDNYLLEIYYLLYDDVFSC